VMNKTHFQNVWVISVLALALIGARRVSPIHHVNVTEAEKLIHDVGAVHIDIGTSSEHASGFIPGALLIPLADLPKRLKELPSDKTQPLLVYSRSSDRSLRAASLLRQSGRKDIYCLRGGLQAWTAAQKPIQIPKK
jgi:rhodanese-related sulfurtransferase